MSDSRTAWIGVFGAVLVALIGGVFTVMNQRQRSQDPVLPTQSPAVSAGQGVMGPLEVGINRQGMDVSDNGSPAENAETCANLCRATESCRSMTYVISLRTCWLKAGVPPPAPPGGPDYISAVKL